MLESKLKWGSLNIEMVAFQDVLFHLKLTWNYEIITKCVGLVKEIRDLSLAGADTEWVQCQGLTFLSDHTMGAAAKLFINFFKSPGIR